ncbi:MAG: hypothetical protein ACRD96_25475, partial [Bryobacteraceae bacterium]
MGRRWALTLLCGLTLRGEGTAPKSAATDYPAHAAVAGLAIGAEYLVRSIAGRGKTFSVDDYLVVEVALFARADSIDIKAGAFTLRMNGKKQPIFSQTPGTVAASLKYPDWEQRPTVVGSAGAGDAGVILGAPRRTERFPGDPRPGQ